MLKCEGYECHTGACGVLQDERDKRRGPGENRARNIRSSALILIRSNGPRTLYGDAYNRERRKYLYSIRHRNTRSGFESESNYASHDDANAAAATSIYMLPAARRGVKHIWRVGVLDDARNNWCISSEACTILRTESMYSLVASGPCRRSCATLRLFDC